VVASPFLIRLSPGADNSGFVGWLATEMKHRLSIGVFVGGCRSSAPGGINDY
jgi:hypothetical protein